MEFLNNDYGDGDMQSQDKTTSDVEGEELEKEDKSIDCFDRLESKFCDVDDILQGI